jgi:hypothetical protein
MEKAETYRRKKNFDIKNLKFDGQIKRAEENGPTPKNGEEGINLGPDSRREREPLNKKS